MDDALADDLREFVAGHSGLWEDGEPAEPPTDAEEAHRLLRRLRWREQELARIEARAAAEIEPIKAWQEDRSAGVQREIARIERSLAAWMLAHHRLTGRKTERFPSGELRAWEAQPRLVTLDEARAVEQIEFLRPEWVKTKRSLDLALIKRQTFPGERVPGPPDDPAPDGYEWRAAMDLADWVGDVFVVRPVLRSVPGVALLWPTRPKFSYKTTTTQEAPTT